MATKPKDGAVRHRSSFESKIHRALHQFALDRAATLQALADKAFRDLTLSGRCYVLEAGKIACEDVSNQFLHAPRIISAYLGS